MKANIFITGLSALFFATAGLAQTQAQNPVLANPATVRDGNVVTVTHEHEIKKSDIRYKDLKEILHAWESMKSDLKSAEKEIREAAKIINDQKKEIRELEKSIRRLQQDVKELQKKQE
jgi:peptidoglycan hydrolase CwlO-like protein